MTFLNDADKPSLEELLHFGVKGMKWGVRKEKTKVPLTGFGPDQIVRKTKNGDTIILSKTQPNPIIKTLAALSSNYRDAYNKGANLDVRDKNGKRVGEANFWKKSDEELYLNWITIKPSARGQGYATSILAAAAHEGRKRGFKKMTLDVPGNAPDARHIYEKLGFTVVEHKAERGDQLWGGLTSMEYKF